MSQETNVEISLQQIEAVNRRDADVLLAVVSPDVEWEDPSFWLGPTRTYRGRAEVREWFNQVILEPWESFHVEVEEITEAADDRVFGGFLITARGKGSGVETELRAWGVVWITDGEITRRKIFLDRDEALEAAGLSELGDVANPGLPALTAQRVHAPQCRCARGRVPVATDQPRPAETGSWSGRNRHLPASVVRRAD
jgi:ketosteroid isomerase-like protein